ncbi:SPOR domain-containing protein [Clostridium oryzae]|uniref:SPOR domain-containing protein n=1 Tax=Clostridium oryzae TaxID=1450648 RepID=A0A1V4IWF3_9CLOT|nr:SPOR domain-containing protein [Clostridium oryzae]OPJ63747.1 hypothetical protein CLORY_09310 [Clostridium oryzae]
MRYTRYDYRRKRNTYIPMPLIFISLIVLAFFIGSIIFNLFIKSPTESNVKRAVPTSSSNKTDIKKTTETKSSNQGASTSNTAPVQSEKYSFIVVQAGYFAKKGNAKAIQKDLKKILNPFTIKEDGKYRVLCGIYNTEDYNKILKRLKGKKITTAKVTYNISIKDNTTKLIAEMIKGNLKILMEFVKADVKFKTKEYVKWANGLKHAEKNSSNYKFYKSYKLYINKMPKEMKKDNCEDNYIYIYKMLKEISKTSK